MAAVDRAASDAEDFTDYLAGFLAAVGVDVAERRHAHDALVDLLRTPVWCQPVPGSRDAIRALASAGVRLAVTSNSDGTVEDHLARHEWVQVGRGPGVPVEVVTDSGLVGVGKPDARVFEATIDRSGPTRRPHPPRRRQRGLRRRRRHRRRHAGRAHGSLRSVRRRPPAHQRADPAARVRLRPSSSRPPRRTRGSRRCTGRAAGRGCGQPSRWTSNGRPPPRSRLRSG